MSAAAPLGPRRFSRRRPSRQGMAGVPPGGPADRSAPPPVVPLSAAPFSVRRLSMRAIRNARRGRVTREQGAFGVVAPRPPVAPHAHAPHAAQVPVKKDRVVESVRVPPREEVASRISSGTFSEGKDSLDAAADAVVCVVEEAPSASNLAQKREAAAASAPPPLPPAATISAVTANALSGPMVNAPLAAAAAVPVSTGMAGATHNPLALLAKLEIRAAGYVYVAMHGGPLKARLFRRSVFKRYAEARGRVVLLRSTPTSPVQEIFSPVGAAVSVADTLIGKRGSVEHTVTVAKQGYTLQLRFSSEAHADHWADVLGSMAAARVPKLVDFKVMAPIGEGASGKVFLVKDVKTGRKLALKCMNKSLSALATSSPDARHAIDERVTHEVMNGSHYIVGLRHAFQTRSKLYLATEFCDGGDVYNYVDSRHGGVSEDHARLITAQVVLGIKKLHDANIVFRDLKPENALITGDGRIRLADFGLCKQLDIPSALTSTVCGTFSYAAAEILSGEGYGRACDLWAVGIFLYHIMIGRPPRVSTSVQEAKANIFDSKEPIIWYSDVMSEHAMSLVTSLIEIDPMRRLGCGPAGIAELFDHPFFKGIDWASLAAGKVPSTIKDALPAPELGDLRNFNQEEWASIVMDRDFDDSSYTESSLWPIRNLGSNPLPADYVVSYAYSAESLLKGSRNMVV